MKKATLLAYIKSLQLRSTWYSLLFTVTGKKRFFDKRIRAGILMLSLLNLLSCRNQPTNQPTVARAFTPPPTKKDTAQAKPPQKEHKKKKVESSIIDDLSVTCYDVAVVDPPVPIDNGDSIATCYIEIEFPPENPQPNNNSQDTIYTIADEMPEFPGGIDSLKQYIRERAIYPDLLEDNNIEGRVIVGIVISHNGEVVKPTILRGIIPEIDSIALQIVRQMPRWKPGKLKGIPVNVNYSIPVKFTHKVKE